MISLAVERASTTLESIEPSDQIAQENYTGKETNMLGQGQLQARSCHSLTNLNDFAFVLNVPGSTFSSASRSGNSRNSWRSRS